MSSTDQDDFDFVMLQRLIKKNLGFNSEQYKEAHFKRRIEVRMRRKNAKNYKDYINILSKDPAEYTALIDALTVNVTNFFRNPETYEAVEKEVLPAIISSKSNSLLKTIRIWSAGCSIGVEAYSIAIILHKLLGSNFSKYHISIIGTDIDKASLFKAELGVYNELEVSGVDRKILDRYFEIKDGRYHIIDDLKKITSFKRNDLISGVKLNGFDAVFCRNVTIYFKKELQETLYVNFYEALNDGGYFIMGKTETLIGPAKDMFKPFNAKERIYSK